MRSPAASIMRMAPILSKQDTDDFPGVANDLAKLRISHTRSETMIAGQVGNGEKHEAEEALVLKFPGRYHVGRTRLHPVLTIPTRKHH